MATSLRILFFSTIQPPACRLRKECFNWPDTTNFLVLMLRFVFTRRMRTQTKAQAQGKGKKFDPCACVCVNPIFTVKLALLRRYWKTGFNGPFPSCCLSRFRSESWCSTIARQMSLFCIRIRNSVPFEWLCTRTRFETEAWSNSEMGYGTVFSAWFWESFETCATLKRKRIKITLRGPIQRSKKKSVGFLNLFYTAILTYYFSESCILILTSRNRSQISFRQH